MAGATVSDVVDPKRDGLAITAEYFQTDKWCIREILKCETLTRWVVDPCCGDGRMADAAREAGSEVWAGDLYDWGYRRGYTELDFLSKSVTAGKWRGKSTFFMNPPFSLACQFVDKAFDLGARKIICFQRQVWRESYERKEWWERRPPNRIYTCGDRAVCWYGTIPMELRKGGANQPHAFYVWERGNPAGTIIGTIYDSERKRRGLRGPSAEA